MADNTNKTIEEIKKEIENIKHARIGLISDEKQVPASSQHVPEEMSQVRKEIRDEKSRQENTTKRKDNDK